MQAYNIRGTACSRGVSWGERAGFGSRGWAFHHYGPRAGCSLGGGGRMRWGFRALLQIQVLRWILTQERRLQLKAWLLQQSQVRRFLVLEVTADPDHAPRALRTEASTAESEPGSAREQMFRPCARASLGLGLAVVVKSAKGPGLASGNMSGGSLELFPSLSEAAAEKDWSSTVEGAAMCTTLDLQTPMAWEDCPAPEGEGQNGRDAKARPSVLTEQVPGSVGGE